MCRVESKKGPFVEERLLARIEAMNDAGKKQMIRTWSRSSTVFPEMVGHTIAVHDGRKHVPGVHLRADGRPQARRVRADAPLPRPRRRLEDAGEAVTARRATYVGATAKFVHVTRPQGAARRGPHPRPQRARGAHDPRVHAARGGARHREGAEERRRERRVEPEPALERRRPRRSRPSTSTRARRSSAGSPARAAASARSSSGPATSRSSSSSPKSPSRRARLPPLSSQAPQARRRRSRSRRQARRGRRRRQRPNGPEGSSRRPARRRHPRLEVELDGPQQGVRGRPARGHQDPRAHHQEALARRAVGHPDPQGQAADHDRHLHGAPGHRDRQVGRRGRRAAQGGARAHAQERPHQHQRDQAPGARREARRAVDRRAAPEPRLVPPRDEALARLGDPLRRRRRQGSVLRPPRRLRDEPLRAVLRGPRAAAHDPRRHRLRLRRGEDARRAGSASRSGSTRARSCPPATAASPAAARRRASATRTPPPPRRRQRGARRLARGRPRPQPGSRGPRPRAPRRPASAEAHGGRAAGGRPGGGAVAAQRRGGAPREAAPVEADRGRATPPWSRRRRSSEPVVETPRRRGRRPRRRRGRAPAAESEDEA